MTDGDIAILQFLAAAEALENDLWQQYTELSQGNVAYQRSLERIDQSLIAYINQDRRDELSHNVLINAVLESIGQLHGKTLTVDVSSFMVVPPPNVTGIAQTPRITNLQTLNVDTSWFNRYRSAQNPDLPPAPGATAQFVTITGQPTIPLSNGESAASIQLSAHCAAFHFAAIEQGGASLYNGLLDAMISPLARAIVASIVPRNCITSLRSISLLKTCRRSARTGSRSPASARIPHSARRLCLHLAPLLTRRCRYAR